jgi:hypothetical protein
MSFSDGIDLHNFTPPVTIKHLQQTKCEDGPTYAINWTMVILNAPDNLIDDVLISEAIL